MPEKASSALLKYKNLKNILYYLKYVKYARYVGNI